MTFYYVATEICRLKWNWLYLIILHCLESIGYSSPLPSLHQFVTNPTAQQLNGTGREVRWSPCYLDYSYTSPVHVQKKMYKDKTLSSLNYAPQRCSQNRTLVEYCRFTLASNILLKTLSPSGITKIYLQALSKQASPQGGTRHEFIFTWFTRARATKLCSVLAWVVN